MPWRLGMPVSPIESLAWLSAQAGPSLSIQSELGRASPAAYSDRTHARHGRDLRQLPRAKRHRAAQEAERRQTAAHAAVCHDAGNSAVIWVFVGGVG